MSETFLVTGAMGWLGKRLVRLMASQSLDHDALRDLAPAKIRCLILPGQDGAELARMGPTVQPVEGDVRNPEDCRKFCDGSPGAIMIHTAGIIHPGKVKEFYEVNLEGARNLIHAAAGARLARVVVVSSNSPIGLNPHADHVFDEQAPYNPYMNYGRSKMMMEEASWKLSKELGIEVVIVRPPWFYGPDQPPRQTLFFSMIKQGKAPIVGNGENKRSMGYVDNLSQGLLLAALSPRAAGQTYWVADRRPYTMNEIIDTIERLLELEFKMPVAHKRMKLPGLASEVAMVVDGTMQKLGLYNQKIHVLSEMNKTIACSIAKAERELGYDPKISLEEGMRRSIAWCLENGMAI